MQCATPDSVSFLLARPLTLLFLSSLMLPVHVLFQRMPCRVAIGAMVAREWLYFVRAKAAFRVLLCYCKDRLHRLARGRRLLLPSLQVSFPLPRRFLWLKRNARDQFLLAGQLFGCSRMVVPTADCWRYTQSCESKRSPESAPDCAKGKHVGLDS